LRHRPGKERFTEAFNLFKGDVFRVAYSYLRSKEAAEDVVGDVFLDYYLHGVRDESNLKGYLVSAAVHRSLNVLKRERRGREIVREAGPINEEERPSLDYEPLYEALSELPEDYGEPIRMFYFASMSVSEISRALSISEDAAKKRLERGRGMLREALKDK
jgi:RNA polymerase sigma-70 factor (ECF subfamily)